MTVYVESNFVLEHSLQQEEYDSCAEIIKLAANGRITAGGARVLSCGTTRCNRGKGKGSGQAEQRIACT
jgi:hypothetical protein